MRTTLTIESDVAVALNRLQKQTGNSLKRIVNDALRRGLLEMQSPPARRLAFRTKAVDLGKCALPDLDNISETLAWAEGEDFR
jgi:hypothetical protein